MRSTLRLFVLCAAASAAVDAAVPQSGASSPVVYQESNTIAAREDGVYSLSGQLQSQDRKLTGRKSVLSALGMLVGVVSAAVISFLLWKCFGDPRKGEAQVSRSRRLAEASGGDTVCKLEELSPEDLKKKAADMLDEARGKLDSDKKQLEEREKKVVAARSAHGQLESALQHRDTLPEGASADAITAADAAVDQARAALKTAVVELGGDLAKFPKLEAQFIRGALKWLQTKQRECGVASNYMDQRRRAWGDVEEAYQKLEEATAALAKVEATGEQESVVNEARRKVEDAAFGLRASIYTSSELDEREDSETRVDGGDSYFATEDESDQYTDVEEVVVELPEMTVDEVDKTAATLLAEALERLEVEAKQLEERKKALNLEEVDAAYQTLKDLNVKLDAARSGGDGEGEARAAFEKQRAVVEPLLLRVREGKPIPADEVLKVPGIFTDFVRGSLNAVGDNILEAEEHQERRQKAWERVRKEHESLKKLKEKVANLEARDRTLQEEAQLHSSRKRLEESRSDLRELLTVAKKKDGIPLAEEGYQPLSVEEYEKELERRTRDGRSAHSGSGKDSKGEAAGSQ